MRTPKALLKFVGKAALSYAGIDLAMDLVFGVFPEVWKDVKEVAERIRLGPEAIQSRRVEELLLRFGPAAMAAYNPQENSFNANLPVLADLVWRNWTWGKEPDELRKELNALVQSSPELVDRAVENVIDQIAPHEPPLVRKAISGYLRCLPKKMNAVFKRPDDLQGQSVPRGMPLKSKTAIVPFLPTIEEVRHDQGFSGQMPTIAAMLEESPFFRLQVLLGLKRNLYYRLHNGQNLIGRTGDEANLIDLTEQEHPDQITVSRRHALITNEDASLFIQDLGSSNGTFVNQHRLQPNSVCPLGLDDLLTFGKLKFVVGR